MATLEAEAAWGDGPACHRHPLGCDDGRQAEYDSREAAKSLRMVEPPATPSVPTPIVRAVVEPVLSPHEALRERTRRRRGRYT